MGNTKTLSFKAKTIKKIDYLEKQLESLGHYFPETFDCIRQKLDCERKTLAEIEMQEYFEQVDALDEA